MAKSISYQYNSILSHGETDRYVRRILLKSSNGLAYSKQGNTGDHQTEGVIVQTRKDAWIEFHPYKNNVWWRYFDQDQRLSSQSPFVNVMSYHRCPVSISVILHAFHFSCIIYIDSTARMRRVQLEWWWKSPFKNQERMKLGHDCAAEWNRHWTFFLRFLLSSARTELPEPNCSFFSY